MIIKDDFLWGIGIGAFLIFLLSSAALIVKPEPKRSAAEQAQLDTLYSIMVGDSASIQIQLRELSDKLHELCHVVSDSKGLDPHYCDE